MRNALLAISVVALTGTLLYLPASQQSAQAQVLGGLKASSGNLVTLVRGGGRGGGRGGHIGGGGRGGHIARGGGGRAMHAYRGGGGRAHVSHPIHRGGYAGNINRGHWNNGHWNGNRYYGNRYYRGRYGYWPWIGVGAGAYAYGNTNCNWLYRHNYRRWLAYCQ